MPNLPGCVCPLCLSCQCPLAVPSVHTRRARNCNQNCNQTWVGYAPVAMNTQVILGGWGARGSNPEPTG